MYFMSFPQVGHRLEHPARNDVALDLGKPEFDLVEPGGIGRSEVLATRFEQKILARLRQHYSDFGPTLAAEHSSEPGDAADELACRSAMLQPAEWQSPELDLIA
jgi:hypothetical protein